MMDVEVRKLSFPTVKGRPHIYTPTRTILLGIYSEKSLRTGFIGGELLISFDQSVMRL